MNSNFLFISNIPKSQRPGQLLKEVDNKWAKILLLEPPHAEVAEAFLYCPTLHVSHFDKTVQKLRALEFDGVKPLKVFYVWFPPLNVVITTIIPHGSILLPYLIVDSIPKNIEEVDVIGDLPFKANDFKQWDISYKEDKWMVLRLPNNQDEVSRNYVLSYIRNKKLPCGGYPRVSEIFVTEDTRLSQTFVPKHLKSLSTNITTKSNIIFVYDLPSKISSGSIADALKHIDFRHCKVCLIDAIDNLRLGFIYTPSSLPGYKFADLMERLKTLEIEVSSIGSVKLNFTETWLQPVNCQSPNVKESNSYSKAEFILTNYLYIHNLNSTVQPCDLTLRCPIPIKVYLYTIPDSDSQFGFVSLKDSKDLKITKVIDYLRSLVCDGMSVLVDEIWLKEYNLPDVGDRRPVFISRSIPFKNLISISRASDSMDIIEGFKINEDHRIRLVDEPAMSSNLMKSSVIFLMNIPENITVEKLLLEINAPPSSKLTLMDTPTGRVGFMFYWQVSDVKWMNAIEKMCYNTLEGTKKVTLKEVYLQCDETVELIQQKVPGIYLSNYVFIYNIGTEGDVTLDELQECKTIVRHCTLTTSSGVRCVIAQLQMELTPNLIIEALSYIRKTKICDRLAYAELIWLGNIDVLEAPTIEPVVHYLKEPEPKATSVKKESM